MTINSKQFFWLMSLVIILFNIGLSYGDITIVTPVYYYIVVPLSIMVGFGWSYAKGRA